MNQKVGFVCFAQFSDWDPNETPPPDEDVEEKVGQHLADVVMIFEDGRQEVQRIRRRFEVNSPSTEWGHLSFAALAHIADHPSQLTHFLPNAMAWGDLQQSVLDNSYSAPVLWISALVYSSQILSCPWPLPRLVQSNLLLFGNRAPERYKIHYQ